MRLFDAHCHLDDRRFADDFDAILQRAKDAGVERITTINCARDDTPADRALEVARTHSDWVTATTGVHPHDARHLNDALLDSIRNTAHDPLIVAIGETGLDYHYDHSPRPKQRDAFRLQIALAKELNKPLMVHTRSAPQDTLEILRQENARDVGGIIHCFSEDALFAKAAVDIGFVCSFSGIVTFKNATGVRDAARTVPLDSLLVETDAPYLAPTPHRGKRNEPAFVAHTAREIAELRSMDPEALAEAAFNNAIRVFGLDQPLAA